MNQLLYTMPGLQPQEDDNEIVMDSIIYDIMIDNNVDQDDAELIWEGYSAHKKSELINAEKNVFSKEF